MRRPMRSLFGFLAFVAVLLGLAAIFLVPAVVSPMVATAVRAASPFGSQPLDVTVDVDALGLVRGFVREIRISGTNLDRDGTRIGSLDVTVQGVGIGDHSFAAVDGGLDRVTIALDDETSLTVDTVDLSGSSDALTAAVQLDPVAAAAFLERVFAEQGLAVTEVELVDGGVSLVIFEQRVVVGLGVEGGALVVADLLGAGSFELLVPQPDDPWRVTGVTVTAAGLTIDALVDVNGVLADSPGD